MKKLIVLIMVLLSVTLVSCGKDSSNNENVGNVENQIEKTERVQPKDKISKNECMNGCYMMWKSNPGNKDKTETDMNQNCEDLCNASQWMENNDLSSCEKTSDPLLKNWCFSKIAKDKKDSSICSKITDITFMDTCYSNLALELNDVSLCKSVKQDIFLSQCYSDIAEKYKDISACDNIQDKMFKDLCIKNRKE